MHLKSPIEISGCVMSWWELADRHWMKDDAKWSPITCSRLYKKLWSRLTQTSWRCQPKKEEQRGKSKPEDQSLRRTSIMAAPKENVGHISTKYVEISCEVAMYCSKCDCMSNVERFYFLDKLKTHRHWRIIVRQIGSFIFGAKLPKQKIPTKQIL